jgi:hypothetical protein
VEVVVDQRVLQRDLGERFHFDCRAAASALALNRNSERLRRI